MHAYVTAFVMAMTLAGVALADPLDDATAAFNRGEYASAVQLLRPLAEGGNVAAQYNLGMMYSQGNGVPEDYLEAIKKTYEHPNAVADMRIPSVFEYYDILEQQTNSALSGQAEPKAALDAAVQQWEALTERIGRDKLQKLYREDLAV